MKKYVSELVGTFVLVFVGCGTATMMSTVCTAIGMLPEAFATVAIAFSFGLSIVAMYHVIGNISGCHVNPAVSLAMLIDGRLTGLDFIGYVVSQFIGALCASAVIMGLFKGIAQLSSVVANYAANGYGENSTLQANVVVALVVEFILTFIFVLTVLSVSEKKENSAIGGLYIGLTLTLVHLVGIPFTGTSVNPARSFAPALFNLIGLENSAALKQVWVFILAPLAGAAVAALLYKYFKSGNKALAAQGESIEEAEEVMEITEEPETVEAVEVVEDTAETIKETPEADHDAASEVKADKLKKEEK